MVLLLLTGCAGKQSIAFEGGNTFSFDIETFKLDDITFTLNEGGKKTTIPLSKNHLTDEDFLKLLSVGTHELKITHDNMTLDVVITLTGQTPADYDVMLYSLKEGDKYVFYTMGTYVSYELHLAQSTNKEGNISNETEGIFDGGYKDGYLAVIHSFGKAVSTHQKVFSVSYDKDVSQTFTLEKMIFYRFDETLFEIKNVIYYQR